MEVTALRNQLNDGLRAFAWDQWAQMGVAASSRRYDRWAADPEALLLFTLEVGRNEPRLLDEVLDWVSANERLLSIQRLRNLAHDADDVALVEALLGWVAQWRKRARLSPRESLPELAGGQPQPFFRAATAPFTEPDPGFLAAGFLKPKTPPSHKSQHPNLAEPINFAFRMRSLLGIGARSEVGRVLVCAERDSFSVQEIAGLTAYAKRNVQEALSSLRVAGVLSVASVGNEQRYEAPRERWATFLGVEPATLPTLVDWPALLHAFRVVLRWLEDPANEELSDYMKASEARALMTGAERGLRAAGVNIADSAPSGAEYWGHFTAAVRDATKALG